MKQEYIDVTNKIMNHCASQGIIHLEAQDESFDGRTITLNGNEVVNFGSCSYLGLGQDQRIKDGAIKAINKYGNQLLSSRTYLSHGLYLELETLLEQIFEKPSIVAPSTTLGHIAAIPLFIGENDAVIMDQSVHTSVKIGVQLLKGNNPAQHIEIVKHNRIDLLETRIQILKHKHDKVWYMADGVYSMHGDPAQLHDIKTLLNQYEQFYLYIDDAHGMSWTGKHGQGFVLKEIGFHPQMIMATSLAKSFVNAGGVIILNDEKMKESLRNCGSTFIFSSPLPPPILGGAIESAKIHLSEEINGLQDELEQRIGYFMHLATEHKLPLHNQYMTPIFFICMGKQQVGYKMVKLLLEKGFYSNISAFPAVPLKNTGVRVTVSNNQSFEDIKNIVETIAEALPVILKEEGSSLEEVYEVFELNKQAVGSNAAAEPKVVEIRKTA